jgi:hypothetical protein
MLPAYECTGVCSQPTSPPLSYLAPESHEQRAPGNGGWVPGLETRRIRNQTSLPPPPLRASSHARDQGSGWDGGAVSTQTGHLSLTHYVDQLPWTATAVVQGKGKALPPHPSPLPQTEPPPWRPLPRPGCRGGRGRSTHPGRWGGRCCSSWAGGVAGGRVAQRPACCRAECGGGRVARQWGGADG